MPSPARCKTRCAVALIAAQLGPAAAGFWALSLRYLKAPATLVGGAVSQALYPKLTAAGGSTPAAGTMVRRVMAAAGGAGAAWRWRCMLARTVAVRPVFGAQWRTAGELAAVPWRPTSGYTSSPARWRW